MAHRCPWKIAVVSFVNQAPWFEDFAVGDMFNEVPPVTLTEGHTAIHQALFGDRLRLVLDHEFCRRVTGQDKPLVHPSLVCNLAIGQSTIPSQRVMGNLFYRGLILRQPVYVGDTLTTSTRVVALRQNRAREGRPASGMVALEVQVANQRGETVMLFWRCPMIPCRDPAAQTGMQDSFELMPAEIDESELLGALPAWNYAAFAPCAALVPGEPMLVEGRDTVTLAPELVRLTLNMAMTHTDAGASVYGQRLVYGGHTISIAAAQVVRVVPQLVSLLGWFHCDHVAPVFEGDILQSTVTLERILDAGAARIGVLDVTTLAERGAAAPAPGQGIKVLDWRVAVILPGLS